MFVVVAHAENGFPIFENGSVADKFGNLPEKFSIHKRSLLGKLIFRGRQRRFADTKRGLKQHAPQTSRRKTVVSSFVTPTRLADGLEAKKSSSEMHRDQIRPKTWFPRVTFSDNFGDISIVSVRLANRKRIWQEKFVERAKN
jgi:hypothetical protein